jgi:hypothetical protein
MSDLTPIEMVVEGFIDDLLGSNPGDERPHRAKAALLINRIKASPEAVECLMPTVVIAERETPRDPLMNSVDEWINKNVRGIDAGALGDLYRRIEEHR